MRRFEPPARKQSPLSVAAGILGAIGGMALANYAGASLWIPGIATGLAALLFAKTPLAPPRFRGAIAVTGGHIAWFIGAGLLTGAWETVGPDIAALTIACAIAWARPSMGGVALLGVVQLASLIYNIVLLAGASFGSADHRALAVHVLWRLIALGLISSEVAAIRREAAAPPA